RVQGGPLAAEVARLEHGADVADPAAADLGIAERVVDDPLVDGSCFLEIRREATGDLSRRLGNDAIGCDVTTALAVQREHFLLFGRRVPGRLEIDGAVASREAVHEFHGGRRFTGGPFGEQDPGSVLFVPDDPGARPVAPDALT